MPISLDESDLAAVVPTWRATEFALFLLYVAVVVYWPGGLIRRLLGWTGGVRAERVALSLLCGIVGSSTIYGLLLLTRLGKHSDLIGDVLLAVFLIATCVDAYFVYRRGRRLRRRPATSEVWGYALILGLAVYYVVRTVSLFDYDGERLRLYGAAHSDKMTSVMPCAGLRYDAPPDNLRFAGYKFLHHYAPHLAAAALEQAFGISYLNGYWFHLPVLGIIVNGLAVMAFARRVLKSYAAGCAAVLLYGLLDVTAVMKPLDLTPALALAALTALDRFAKSQRRRWAVATFVLIGFMACYEVFHAATLLGGLGLWGAAGVAVDLGRRRSIRLERLWLPAAAAVTAFAALQAMSLGHKSVTPQIVFNNTFGDSYRHEWLGRAKVDDAPGRALATLYSWNRNRVASDAATGERPRWYERVVGRVTFGLGLPLYVYARFGLWATFGLLHVARRRRPGLRSSEAIIAATGCVGFGLPWVVDVGLHGSGQWWASPNLYRVTEFAAWLMATFGAAALVDVLRTWRRLRSLPLLAVTAFALFTSAEEHRPAGTYFDVPRSQLETIAFLQLHVPDGQAILHPWWDCSIRNAVDGGEAYLQKRFFMLVSELAGRQCYSEGRAEYLYWNGRIPHEEIERRQNLRHRFYHEPTEDEVREVVDDGGVSWVVTDASNPLPTTLDWTEVFHSGEVQVYRRP